MIEKFVHEFLIDLIRESTSNGEIILKLEKSKELTEIEKLYVASQFGRNMHLFIS